MRSLNILNICIIILGMIIAVSCKKSESATEQLDPKPGEKPGEKPDSVPPATKLLPVKIVYGKLTTTFEYTPNTARLKEIRKSTGDRYVFIYNADHELFGYEIFINQKSTYNAQILRNQEGKPTTVVRFNVDPEFANRLMPVGNIAVEFNSLGQLYKIKTHNPRGDLTEEKTLEYHENGMFYKATSDGGVAGFTTNYAYDSMNGIYKNISEAALINIIHDDIGFSWPANNIISYTSTRKPDEDRTISYVYNVENYPSEMKVTRKKWKETHVITYAEMIIP